MSPFLETIRIENGRPRLLQLHANRLDRTRREALRATAPIESSLADYIARLDLPPSGTHKLRVLYRERIESHTLEAYRPRRIQSLRLVHDDSIDYSYKSTDRTSLDRLLSLRNDCDEILIVKGGYITDTSFSNIAFLRQGLWYTPATPLLAGVMRRDLLDRGLLHEIPITIADLSSFEAAALINSMLDPGTTIVTMDRIHP